MSNRMFLMGLCKLSSVTAQLGSIIEASCLLKKLFNKTPIFSTFTYLLWLSLHNNLIHVIFLADFYKVHDSAINDGFGVQFDNIINFVDLYS